MNRKQKKAIQLQVLKAEGKAGLDEFNRQQRVTGRMRSVQTHSNAAYDAAKGYRRKPKHRGFEE